MSRFILVGKRLVDLAPAFPVRYNERGKLVLSHGSYRSWERNTGQVVVGKAYPVPQDAPGYALATARCRLAFAMHSKPDPAPVEQGSPSSNTGLLAQFEPLNIHDLESPELEISDLENFQGVSAKGSIFGGRK